MKLELITFKDYVVLADKSEYNFAMKYATRFKTAVDELNLGSAMSWKFGIVKDLQFDLGNEMSITKAVDYISLISGVELPEIANYRIDQISRTIAYIQSEIENISNIERIKLSHETTAEQEMAGLEDFSDLGVYMQIRELAGNDVTKIEAVRNLPYDLCFIELYARKKINQYEKKINEIYRQKQKNH
jgi:hypothetical protein